MKRIFWLFILFIPGLYTFADDYDFSALQGLRDKQGNIYFEISGYDIFCSSFKGKMNSLQTIDNFKKRQKIKGIQAEYSDSNLPLPNKIIETDRPLEKNPKFKYNQVFYLFSKSEDDVNYVVFQTLNQRDISLEKEFISAFLDEKLSEYISDDWTGESISFAGKVVQLGTACQWRSPHNLFFRGGQISWSEFSSAEKADSDLNTHIAANDVDSTAVLSKDFIEVIFEGVPTIACRVAYMAKGRYYPLIVYYLTQEIGDRYVSCVMSNYGYNRNDYELSPLLQQFMSIPSPPDWAYNQFDIPQYEDVEDQSNQWWTTNIELRLGSVFPSGNLSHNFQFAPSLDFFLCFPVKQKMSIDLGMMLSFPTGRKPFDYTYKGETSETKASGLVDGSLRYRYRHTISKNLFCYTYCGIGVSSLSTDLLKEIDSDNRKTYYSVEGLDLFGGIQLNYKKLGWFIEYHRTTFSNSSKVANDFGNSFLNTGFTYYFKIQY